MRRIVALAKGCMALIKFASMLFADEIFRLFGYSKLYYSRVGIKCINRPRILNPSRVVLNENVVTLQPDELYLGFDFLNDDYTLLDTKIIHSPHYYFLKAMNNGEELRRTEYLQRVQSGCLDFRRATPVLNSHLKRYKNTFERRKYLIMNDTYDPVIVYEVNGRTYVADGKHRSALCSILGRPVRCAKIDMFTMSPSFLEQVCKKMTLRQDQFVKTLRLFDSARSIHRHNNDTVILD